MLNKKPPLFRVDSKRPYRNEPGITCRCGKEFNDLEDLIISLDDAGFTFYCETCPEIVPRLNPNQYYFPYA